MSIDQSQSARGTARPTNSPSTQEKATWDAKDPLHEIELKYQRLVEGIGGDYVIYTHDPDGVITYVSPSIESVLGFSPQAVLGINWRELIGEQYIGREIAERVGAEVATGKDFYSFTVEMSHANGGTLLVEIQQRPLFDAAGNYLSMEGIAKDITETMRSAEELQRLKDSLEQRVADRTSELIRSNERLLTSEERYRTLVECQTDFVVRWVPEATFTYVNKSFCQRLGQTRDELIGTSFLPLLHPDDGPVFQEVIAQLDYESPFADFRNRIRLPDGSLCWIHWTNQMLFDEEGQFLEFQSVGRDFTELKKAADTIRQKEAHLAHISRLATMGELVAGMAHEVHQPLHAAKTFAEAARRNLEMSLSSPEAESAKNTETAMDCLQEISSAISRTASIIRTLREFTHASPVKFEHLSLNQIVHEASELIAYETRKARVKLTYGLASDLPVIQGDRIQLVQICVNLFINAYDAMSEVEASEREVRIRTHHDSGYVRLSFCDVGCGIEIGNEDRLFEAFHTTKSQGMGMGLSVCKSIAETHGGKIGGQRNEGVGMTFTLELPKLRRLPSNQSNQE